MQIVNKPPVYHTTLSITFPSYHLYAAVFLKCGGKVSHHLLCQDLHCLGLQLVFPHKVLAG